MLESYEPTLFQDPMVEEANIWDSSLEVRLADSVLKWHLSYLKQFSPQDSELSKHVDWIHRIFPELSTADEIPDPWTWVDLATKVENVGTVDSAESKCSQWIDENQKVAYWTGGLEFTRNQHAVSEYLISKEFLVLVGIEPFCYSSEFVKERGPLSYSAVPLSFWSKYLGENGFIFNIPRPLPENEKDRDKYYMKLFQQITSGKGYIVVSSKDSYIDKKRKRGQIVEVPVYNYPSTTELWESYFK